jgi:hypothetical protein
LASITEVAFADLPNADLVIDCIYRGKLGQVGAGADALAHLLPCGNQGGIRFAGNLNSGYRMVVLYTSFDNPDWPDNFDEATGILTYFGDNRTSGAALAATPRGGNKVLDLCFAGAHGGPANRSAVPPIFVFCKEGRAGRDVRFLGLAVPGAKGLMDGEDLVAIWRTSEGRRFQNYRATFTILDEGLIPRKWLKGVELGQPLTSGVPKAWLAWRESKEYEALAAPRVLRVPSQSEQEPTTKEGREIVAAIHKYFGDDSAGFERCAAELWKMSDPNVVSYQLTRPTVDGGRDAVGEYGIGPDRERIRLDFALEAKCYAPGHGVGVRWTSRLISRIRPRQFGVLVTTSHINGQAYREIREDRHPIVILCGRDIAHILRGRAITSPTQVTEWLTKEFPV